MPARIWGAVPAIAALLALLLSVGLVACGSMVTASLEEETMRENSAAATTAAPVASRGATAAPQATQAPMLASEEEASEGGATGFYQNTPLNDEALRSIVPQNRVIVRTVDIGIIVPNVPRSLAGKPLAGFCATQSRRIPV